MREESQGNKDQRRHRECPGPTRHEDGANQTLPSRRRGDIRGILCTLTVRTWLSCREAATARSSGDRSPPGPLGVRTETVALLCRRASTAWQGKRHPQHSEVTMAVARGHSMRWGSETTSCCPFSAATWRGVCLIASQISHLWVGGSKQSFSNGAPH